MRRGFNILMAIFMLLLLGGLGALTLRYARISSKHFADSYVKEQAQLFMDSVIEYTIMKIEGYDRSSNNDCLQSLVFDSPDGRFEAKVAIKRYYLYHGKDNKNNTLNCSVVEPIKSPESHGYVLLEVIVTTKPDAKVVSPVRITRRVLQRP